MVPLPAATTTQGGVDINEQGAVFHPLNGSGARGTTGRSNPRRRKQKDSPKSFTRGTTSQHRQSILLYRTTPRFPLVHLFFFGVQNRFFFCNQKKKWFWPQPGRQKKKQLQVKNIPLFPQKKKRFHPQDARPIRKAAKPPTAGLWPQPGRPQPTKQRRVPFSPKEKADL